MSFVFQLFFFLDRKVIGFQVQPGCNVSLNSLFRLSKRAVSQRETGTFAT